MLAPAWIGFDGAAQVAQLWRGHEEGQETVEVVYLITSDPDADPVTLAGWVRSHWEIENRLHWVRDVTYLEDKSPPRSSDRPPRCSAGRAGDPRSRYMEIRFTRFYAVAGLGTVRG